MVTDRASFELLESALKTPRAREIFKTVIDNRVAETAKVAPTNEDSGIVDALANENLIGQGFEPERGIDDERGSGQDRRRLYVTAKGLKVARDLKGLLH